ncbi:MAG TPA: hypothetical protein VJ463_09960 [Geothrix sp.]|nr:hypothetical protein [Geothrix sp.]
MPSAPHQDFQQGQTVRIRSAEEIARTLDADGRLEGLPFMPEMARFCGTRARIHRHADKTCVEGYGLRHMDSTVILEDLRCDGSSHDGCQRTCMLFWKQAWLSPLEDDAPADAPAPTAAAHALLDLPTTRGDRYVCQSTELHQATRPMSRWNVTHFFREIRRGELSLPGFMQILYLTSRGRLRLILGLPLIPGMAGEQKKNSRGDLGLKPGDWVEVRSHEEITATLDPNGKNSGLSFEPGMLDCLGKRYQVEHQLERIILEQTGKMATLAHTVTLKGVTCQGPCSKNCPRNNALFWRESWLRRV